MVLKKWVAAVTAAAVAMTSGSVAVFFGAAKAAAAEDKNENVVEISSLDDLKAFRDDVNSGNDYKGVTVMLTQDIDLGDEEWAPIGAYALDHVCAFSGEFDGLNHEITGLNLNINSDTKALYGSFQYYGLFGWLEEGTIANLKVSGKIDIDDSTVYCGYVGSIVGFICTGLVENCSSSCTITVSASGSVGGIAGAGRGTVSRCYNTGDITVQSIIDDNVVDKYDYVYVGGIVGGGKMVEGIIENCYNTGNITVNANKTDVPLSYNVGGILGRSGYIVENKVSAKNCYNTGTITFNKDNIEDPDDVCIGGIMGAADISSIIGSDNISSALVEGCVYLESCIKVSDNISSAVKTEDFGAQAKAEDDLKKSDTFTELGWDLDNVWSIDGDSKPVLCKAETAHTHNEIEFLPWDHDDSLPPTSGSYYLTKNVTLDELVTIDSDNLNLCLNGHTVTAESDTDEASAITIDGAALSIYDYSFTKSGKITCERSGSDPCGQVISNDCTLNIYGGTLVAENGCGIRNSGTLNLCGGTVKGSVSGVIHTGGALNLSGDPVIEGEAADIYLCKDAYINITGELTKTYGISMAESGVFTNSTDKQYNDPERFVPLDSEYEVKLNGDGQLELVKIKQDVEPQTITVTLHYQYSEGEDAEKTDTISATVGGKYDELPEKPERDGYTFDGWFTEDDTQITKDTDVDPDIDALYAHWTKDPDAPPADKITVTLHYQYSEGDDGEKTGTISATVGGKYDELPENPERTGYTFNGWYTKATDEEEGNKRIYSSDDVDGNISELFARWEKDADFITVTLHYQYPEEEDKTAVIDIPATSTYGDLAQLKKPGHIFLGWFADPADGEPLPLDEVIDPVAHPDLYAHWKVCEHNELVSAVKKEAACTEPGWEAGEYCETCGYDTREVIPPIGHDWEYQELVKDPTLTAKGLAKFVCLNDDSHVENFDVPELSDKDEWTLVEDSEFTFAAECGQDGNQRYHSEAYGYVDLTLPKLGHQWDNGTITAQPTQTRDGFIVYKCMRCGEERTERIPALGGSTGTTPPSQPSNTTTPAPQPSNTTTPAPQPSSTTTTTPAPQPSSTTTTAPKPSNTTTPAPKPSTTTPPNTGSGVVSADSGANAPNVRLDSAVSRQLRDEVMAYHLTAAERAAVENGAQLDIVVSVQDASASVSAAEKSSTEQAAAASSYTVGQYLNIDILKLIDGQQTGKITQLNTPISITVDVPANLRSSGRRFAIVRVHDGKAELLKDTDSVSGTITISTDKFSTYAIVYQDAADVQAPSENGSTDKNPGTGVYHPATELAVLALAFGGAAALLVVTKLTRKKK